MSFVLLLAVAGLIGWGLYSVSRPRPVFVVRITDGVPRIARGRVTKGFLRDVAEVCDRHRVRYGEICAVASGRRINLMFSREIPKPCQQQVRNLWSLSGWSGG